MRLLDDGAVTVTAADLTDMAADFLAAREPLRCPCGAKCDHSHGLCADCDAWAETLGGAA